METAKHKALPPELEAEYWARAEKCGECRKKGDVAGAEALILEGWRMLPEPKEQWGCAQETAAALARFYLQEKLLAKAKAWIPTLETFAGGDSTYIDILIGQIYLECDEPHEALKRFQSIHDKHGKTAFRGENTQYLQYITPKKKPAKKKTRETKTANWPVVPDPEAYKLMAGPIALDESLHEEITRLCEEGDQLAEEEDAYDAAIEKYREALLMLPRPIEKWDASTWIYTAIGDALFLKGDFLEAANPLRDVMYCPGAKENAFVRLRRGQVAFEKGNLPVAEKELAEAYHLAGEDIFAEDDAKYLVFVKEKLKI